MTEQEKADYLDRVVKGVVKVSMNKWREMLFAKTEALQCLAERWIGESWTHEIEQATLNGGPLRPDGSKSDSTRVFREISPNQKAWYYCRISESYISAIMLVEIRDDTNQTLTYEFRDNIWRDDKSDAHKLVSYLHSIDIPNSGDKPTIVEGT
jgi:hypothetical protein